MQKNEPAYIRRIKSAAILLLIVCGLLPDLPAPAADAPENPLLNMQAALTRMQTGAAADSRLRNA
ncbi:MAG: hypothetical protein GY862_27860, partial [Gammaproteobacteria bacterium]|nr:hypothetical protein [Gammaproteobacteria bacterium]